MIIKSFNSQASSPKRVEQGYQSKTRTATQRFYSAKVNLDDLNYFLEIGLPHEISKNVSEKVLIHMKKNINYFSVN